ncbi:MAG: efflux RND transporter periplasmic adaptor subunit [Oligoflexus sp.]
MLIFIRVLAFVGIALGFVFATYWKIGVITEKRQVDVVTIQGEYENFGRPVVVYRVDQGKLFDYEKLTLQPLGNRSLEAMVPNNVLSRLEVGQKAIVLGEEITGKVHSLSRSPQLLSGLYRATIRLDRAPIEPLSEQVIARVKINETAVKARVPRNAVSRKGENAYVYRVEGGVALRTQIGLGKSDENYYEIRSGLKAGDVIVAKGHRYIDDKQKVRPVAEQEAAIELVERR